MHEIAETMKPQHWRGFQGIFGLGAAGVSQSNALRPLHRHAMQGMPWNGAWMLGFGLAVGLPESRATVA